MVVKTNQPLTTLQTKIRHANTESPVSNFLMIATRIANLVFQGFSQFELC